MINPLWLFRAIVFVAALGLLWKAHAAYSTHYYDAGYNARNAEVEAVTRDLNNALEQVDKVQSDAALALQEMQVMQNELERQLARERMDSDDDTYWSIDRVRRFNRAGRPE